MFFDSLGYISDNFSFDSLILNYDNYPPSLLGLLGTYQYESNLLKKKFFNKSTND